MHTIDFGDIVQGVAWCPNASLSLLAVISDETLFLLNAAVGSPTVCCFVVLLLLKISKSCCTGAGGDRLVARTQFCRQVTRFRLALCARAHRRRDYVATSSEAPPNLSPGASVRQSRRASLNRTKQAVDGVVVRGRRPNRQEAQVHRHSSSERDQASGVAPQGRLLRHNGAARRPALGAHSPALDAGFFVALFVVGCLVLTARPPAHASAVPSQQRPRYAERHVIIIATLN